jgi:hypothetical protein
MGKSPGASLGILTGALDVALLKTFPICMLHLPTIKEVVCRKTG